MPVVLDAAVPGCDNYVMSLPPITTDVARSWSYHGNLRSYQWNAGGVLKSRAVFGSHRQPDDFFAMLEEGASRGVDRPSSYASFFHDRYRSPRASGPARRAMTWFVPGGWEALLVDRGDHEGRWYRYDLRSAYLWALGDGLPDPATYRYTERVHPRRQGCYVVDCQPTPGAPYPYDRGGVWPITTEELERYGIRYKLRYGITWDRLTPPGPMLDVIMSWSFWKEVGRAYWGRWAATAPLECASYKEGKRVRRWELPPTHANPIWAHVVLSRVRARLHDATRVGTVARVYVDNVIIDRRLPVGDDPGCWRFEAEYDGIRVANLHRITSLRRNTSYAAA